MCLGIPGRLVELIEDEQLARVDVNGVGRIINIALLDDEVLSAGDWVLIHVGFAMAKIDEAEAHETLQALRQMGDAYGDELDAMARSTVSGTEGSEGRAVR
jgi:hydrogenase expression/formation protein HypC